MEEKVLNGSISKEAQAAMIRKERTANNAWHKFCRNKSAVVGLIIISLMILMGVLAPVLSPHDPNQINVLQTYLPPFSEGHILGTDDLGRDLLSRLLYGARMSIVVAIGATVLGGVIGILLGLISGYAGGVVDAVIMRIMDGMFAFPFILLSILLVTILGSGVSGHRHRQCAPVRPGGPKQGHGDQKRGVLQRRAHPGGVLPADHVLPHPAQHGL